jgi:hypothetical protein
MQYNPGSSVQHVQHPIGQVQNQIVNFGTSGQVPPLAQKIAPSVQRIRRDVDPNISIRDYKQQISKGPDR